MTSSASESQLPSSQNENNSANKSAENGNIARSEDKPTITRKSDAVLDGKVSKPKRAHAGCLTCRHRHKKCTRERPVCHTCLKSNYNCFWREPGTRFTDYKVKLSRTSNPKGTILQPNPSSSDNIPSTRYYLSEDENDNPMPVNNSTGNDINILGDDSLIKVAQKAVSITNAYMNSQEMQTLLNQDPEEEIERIEVKPTTTDEVLKDGFDTIDQQEIAEIETNKEEDNADEQEHEKEEEENKESDDEHSHNPDSKKGHDSEDDDDNGNVNGNHNAESNSPEGEFSNKDNDNDKSSKSDDLNQSSQHRNTAINLTQDLDALKLLKFKTLLDTSQNENLIVNEGTLINFPSDRKSRSISSWYTKFLNSPSTGSHDDLSDEENLDPPSVTNDALTSLKSFKSIGNTDLLSPALILSRIVNEKMLEKCQQSSETKADNNGADYGNQLETIQAEPNALVCRLHNKRRRRRSGKLKDVKMISKEMGAKLLLDSISKSKKNYDRCKIYKDGRRKHGMKEKHVDLSELPSYITQFLKQS